MPLGIRTATTLYQSSPVAAKIKIYSSNEQNWYVKNPEIQKDQNQWKFIPTSTMFFLSYMYQIILSFIEM